MSKIRYYYYYLFYNAYWTSFDLGEKTIPRQNAVHYMNIVKVFLWVSIVNILMYADISVPYVYLFFAGVITIFFIDYHLLSKNVFKSYYDKYVFIRQKRKGERLRVFWTTFVLTVVLCLATATLNIDL